MRKGRTTNSSKRASPVTSPEALTFADLATESGIPVPCASNLPLDMGHPQSIWFIEEGAVDLFLIEYQNGVERSAPQHLLRAESGRFLPGIAPQKGDATLSLIAKGLPGTMLRRLSVASLAVIHDAELAEQVDTWIMDVSASLSRDIMPRPQPDVLVGPGDAMTIARGTLSARHGVVWVPRMPAGAGLFLNLIDPTESDRTEGTVANAIPLTPTSWLTLVETAQISTQSSKALAEEGLLLSALASFHAMALSLEQLNRNLAVADQANLERARVTNRRDDEEHARHRLFNLYDLPHEKDTIEGSDTTLFDVLQVIGKHEGIDFKRPTKADRSDPIPFSEILDASGVRSRQIRLDPEDRWWIGDSGAILAFRADNNQPVALLPSMLGHYREVIPTKQHNVRVTAKCAESLRADAHLFYKPLPSSNIQFRDMFKLVKRGLIADFVRFAAAGLLGGLVMMLPAVAIGFVVDNIIPTNEVGLLYLTATLLGAFALIGALLHILQGMTLMRLEGRAASRLEAALWDRLLRLPLKFLHRYPAGDLAMRGMAFQTLRDAARAVIANTVLLVVFLLPAFFLIFFYDAALGSVIVAFSLLSLIVTVALGLSQIAPHTRMIRAIHHLAGQMFQFINGIAKLRVGDAEGTAFAVLARDYREQKRAELELGTLEEHLRAFGSALPLLAGAVLFLAATMSSRSTLSIGDFLVVYTVLMVFQAAVTRLSASFSAIAAIMPEFDQIRPFLAELPETSVEGEPVEVLGGKVLFDHVSFRYDPDGPLVLDDVTIHAEPGEFIAIAGESGAGKSTIFRLALGLDQPSSGAVYYDGRDIRHLNLKQLRRRIGVVPQGVQLHPEDVWDNIVGDQDETTADEAWKAARIAAVDHEIKSMPMGMLTAVGASASLTSGGESQRIMIAHALVRNPRILLLDEATNWLDNNNQARVMANLADISATRIVIAHRLSTLRQADRIYVMQSGKVIQQGTFGGLMAISGAFQDLVRKQVA